MMELVHCAAQSGNSQATVSNLAYALRGAVQEGWDVVVIMLARTSRALVAEGMRWLDDVAWGSPSVRICLLSVSLLVKKRSKIAALDEKREIETIINMTMPSTMTEGSESVRSLPWA